MDITQLPFNRLIGLEREPDDSAFLVSLPGGSQYTNHLGTVHASALLAVAEAASGVLLVRGFSAAGDLIPVVRRLEARFRRPASGRLSARATVAPDDLARWNSDLAARGRVIAAVPVEVVDAAGGVVLSVTVEWFIARSGASAAGT